MTSAFIFVMAITFHHAPFEAYEYVGHFQSCQQANDYVALNHPTRVGSRCLFEEYIVIPKDTIKKEIIMEGRSSIANI